MIDKQFEQAWNKYCEDTKLIPWDKLKYLKMIAEKFWNKAKKQAITNQKQQKC